MTPDHAHSAMGFAAGSVRAFLGAAARQGLAVLVSEGDVRESAGRCRFANAAAAELLEQPLEEMRSCSIGPDEITRVVFVADEAQDLSVGAVREVFGELRLRDGRKCRIQWTTVVSVVRGEPLTVHLLRRAGQDGPSAMDDGDGDEVELMDDELRFRRLMDVAPDGIVIFSGPRIAYANLAMAELQGYSHPRQLLQLSQERLVHEDDLAAFRSLLARARGPSAQLELRELRVIRRDGSTLPVEAMALRIDWDEAPALLLTVRDLSGRRLVQSQLAHRDRLAAVGTMAAGVAHEINNPLAYVLLNLEYLLREVPKLEHFYERTGHLLDRLREARHGAERVAAIVGDLRTFSKANEEELCPVELRLVLTNAIRVARTQLGERGRIIEEYADTPRAMGHASRLEQVFLNLLINAVQALPSDRAHDNCIRIRTGLERRGCSDWVVVEVADNGAGIPPGLVDRVFDPFFTTKPVGMGTGLGLPICHSIVTRMGGNVAVKSELGEGTSFFVSLPVASADTLHAAIPPAISVVRSTRRAKILVIDDEPAVATTLSRLLGEEHDVVVATDGQHALECLERQSFDVVLCDLLMPEMSGMELYEELRRRNPAQAERVAFMSGGAFTPRAASFLAQVQNPRIEKPFDLLAVLGLVARITGQAQGA